VKTAAPTPKATASPPIRPIYLEAFILSPSLRTWKRADDELEISPVPEGRRA